ncbi:MAG TPA: hypothetical protein VIH90_01060 [Candidatus Saccharimonadales bacterium]
MPAETLDDLRQLSKQYLEENGVEGITHGQRITRAVTPGSVYIERIGNLLRLSHDSVKHIGLTVCDVTTKVQYYDLDLQPPEVFDVYTTGSVPARQTHPIDEYPQIISEFTRLISDE